jgi:RNA polymerase II subunit A small phosphatase-like protein
MQRHLVIFDLDETLVHATKSKLTLDHSLVVDSYFVYERPYVRELLRFASEHFDLAVWSSSAQKYVQAIVGHLFGTTYPLKFSWSVERCVQRVDPASNGYVYIKDLRKVRSQGYLVDQITIIDDSPEKIQRQPKKHIRVQPYLGNPADVELLAVQSALEAIFLECRS